MAEVPVVDWGPLDPFPESTCHCRCGVVFRSHAKVVGLESGMRLVTRKPCPGCGVQVAGCYRVSSDPETMTLG